MEKPARIIIFHDDEEKTTYVHSNTPLKIINFYRNQFEVDPETVITIDGQEWSLMNRIESEDPMDKNDFENTWSLGENFITVPARIQKAQQLEAIDIEIEKKKRQLDLLQNQRNTIDKSQLT